MKPNELTLEQAVEILNRREYPTAYYKITNGSCVEVVEDKWWSRPANTDMILMKARLYLQEEEIEKLRLRVNHYENSERIALCGEVERLRSELEQQQKKVELLDETVTALKEVRFRFNSLGPRDTDLFWARTEPWYRRLEEVLEKAEELR